MCWKRSTSSTLEDGFNHVNIKSKTELPEVITFLRRLWLIFYLSDKWKSLPEFAGEGTETLKETLRAKVKTSFMVWCFLENMLRSSSRQTTEFLLRFCLPGSNVKLWPLFVTKVFIGWCIQAGQWECSVWSFFLLCYLNSSREIRTLSIGCRKDICCRHCSTRLLMTPSAFLHRQWLVDKLWFQRTLPQSLLSS